MAKCSLVPQPTGDLAWFASCPMRIATRGSMFKMRYLSCRHGRFASFFHFALLGGLHFSILWLLAASVLGSAALLLHQRLHAFVPGPQEESRFLPGSFLGPIIEEPFRDHFQTARRSHFDPHHTIGQHRSFGVHYWLSAAEESTCGHDHRKRRLAPSGESTLAC